MKVKQRITYDSENKLYTDVDNLSNRPAFLTLLSLRRAARDSTTAARPPPVADGSQKIGRTGGRKDALRRIYLRIMLIKNAEFYFI